MSSQNAQQRPAVQFGHQEVRSLQTLNQHLSALGINSIDRETHERFLQQKIDDLKVFCSAVRQAPQNANARLHVINSIAAYLPADAGEREPGADDDFPPEHQSHGFEAAPGNHADAANEKVTDINNARAHRGAQAPCPAEHAPPQTQGGEQQRERISEHCYAGKGALTFEANITKRNVPTVTMDAAKSIGDKVYDWKNKVSIQFTRDEMPAVTALFHGLLPAIKFGNHGPENNKSFEMANQQGKIFVKVIAPGVMIPVPIAPADASYVASLLLRQLLKAQPHLRDPSGVIQWLRHTYVRLVASASAPQQ